MPESDYVHTNHLNTPVAVTRPSDNKLRWQWHPDAFGVGAPNENPQSLGAFKYNLRFPGQYYDQETGQYYNYFRDYDSLTGRYVQSDPMGLMAGVNTYGYVGSDPLDYVDPDGLDETHTVNTAGGRSIWDGPTNGNWGGKCWSGGQYSCGGHPNGKAPPTDSADKCYMHHDNCWANCGGNKQCLAACNNTLVQELLALSKNPKKWPMPPRKGTEADSSAYRQEAIRWFN